MNTVFNMDLKGVSLAENHTASPKGNDTVDTVFQTPVFRGDGVSKDTRLSLRSARSLDTSRPLAAKMFSAHLKRASRPVVDVRQIWLPQLSPFSPAARRSTETALLQLSPVAP